MTFYILTKYTVPGNQGTQDKLNQFPYNNGLIKFRGCTACNKEYFKIYKIL